MDTKTEKNNSVKDKQIVQLSIAILDVSDKVNKTLSSDSESTVRGQVKPMLTSV